MANLESAVGNNAYLKVLLVGASGCGKTVMGTGFPLPLYVADFDGKVTSAANYWSVHDKERLKHIDFDNFLPTGAKGGDSISKFMKMLEGWEKQVIAKTFTLKTIQIDSFTAMADSLMSTIIGENPGLKRTEALTPVMQDWMIFTPHWKNIIYRLLALPCNLVCIAHVKVEKDEITNMITNSISLPGQLPGLMPKLFGEVYYCYVQANKEGTQFQHLALTKSPTDKYVTRTQIQGLPNIIPMDYNFIKQAMSTKTQTTKE